MKGRHSNLSHSQYRWHERWGGRGVRVATVSTDAMTGKKRPERQHWARHHRVLAAVLIVLIVVGVALAIAQDQETLRIRTSLGISDPRFPQYLAELLGHRL